MGYTNRVLARTTVNLHDGAQRIPANSLTWVDPGDAKIKEHLGNGLLVLEHTGTDPIEVARPVYGQVEDAASDDDPPQHDTLSVPSRNT